MSDALDTLHDAADLVKRWGQAVLPNGNTLSEMLSLDGVSLWEVVAPALAAMSIPKDLARKMPPSFLTRRIKPYLSWAKRQTQTLFPFPRSAEGCARWPTGPVCLMLGFSGYMYRDILEPVALYLAENRQMDYVALHEDGRFNTGAVKFHSEKGQSIWEHWNNQVTAHELVLRRKLSVAVKYLETAKILPGVINDSRPDLWPHVEITFRWLLRVYLPSLLPYFALTRHILEAHRPSIIVSPDVADPRTRLFCLAGRLLGISSLDVQFGMYGEDSVEWQFCVADRVAVWGDHAFKVLAAHGVPQERLIVTGSPRLGGIADVSDEYVGRERSRLGVPQDQFMVLFASQYALESYSEFGDYPSALRAVKRAIFQAADRVDGMCLVVKPHPFENVRETRQIAEDSRKIIFADPKDDIRGMIKACDVFITLGSTATMDALAARKLAIFPDFPGLVWWDDMYLKNNVALVAKSEDELVHLLQLALNGQRERLLDELEPARQRFLRHWVGQMDGKAAGRIVTLALQLAHLE